MTERVNTALLVLLVISSLVQTYLLAYSQPEFDPISHDEYVEAEWVGPQKALQSLMMPKEIIVHMGEEDQHTVFYPYFQFYDLIFGQLRERTFGGFREVTYQALDVPSMRETELGIELRFAEPVPADILSEMMSLRSDAFSFPDEVNRIWITSKEDGTEVRTYFFTKSAVYEATSSDMMRRDLEQFVRYGEQMKTYTPLWFGEYYVPKEQLTVHQVTLPIETYTAEQLQTSLFSDPGASRSLLEQNGTEIFTDGKRGLQIDHAKLWMRFSDPSAPVDSRPQDRTAGLNKALQFVNRHGGWNGDFLLEKVVSNPYGPAENIVFRQYYAPFPNQTALPIIPSREGRYGYIEVTVQQGMITNYERSLLAEGLQPIELTEVQLPGGEELQKLLDKVSDSSLIEDVFVGYYPVIEDEQVHLIPKWVARIGESDYLFLHE